MIGLNSVTTWNQRSSVSDGHGYWTQPVNSSGVSTTANMVLIRFGGTAVPSSMPMPEPASAPSTMKTTSIQARSARSDSGPMIQRPMGNISAPANSARSEANSILSTATMPSGSGASSRLDLLGEAELDHQRQRRALQGGEHDRQRHQTRQQQLREPRLGEPQVGQDLAEDEGHEQRLEDRLGGEGRQLVDGDEQVAAEDRQERPHGVCGNAPGFAGQGGARPSQVRRDGLDTFPQHAPQQLAGDGPRHRFHELDLARELVDGELRPAVVDDLLLERVARGGPLLQHHERLGVLPAYRVGSADDPDVGHGGVGGDRHLDLDRK